MPFLGRTPTQLVDPEVDINGGAIDGVTIGATSASPATVTTFTSTGIDDNAASNAITIDSSGNVGINITPSYTLDIQAVGSSFNPVRFSGHSASIDAFLYTDTAYWSIGDTAAYGGNLWGGNKTSNFVHAYTNGSERMRIDSSGNVGIGTTGPNYKLDVVGAIRATNSGGSTIIANRTSNPGSFELQYDGTQTAQFSALSGGGVATYTGSNPTERMRINSSGYIGIANSSPGARLDIQTPSYATSTTDGMIKFNDSVNAHHCNIQSYHVGGQGADIIVGSNAYVNTSGGWTRWTASYGGSALRFGREGVLSFLTNSSAGIVTERMRIDSSGNVIIKPSGKLYLESSSGFSPYLVEASNALTVNTNNTERMRINNSGNVGIGTTSPTSPLHVAGSGTVAFFEGTGGAGFVGIRDSDDGTIGYIGVDGGKLLFQTSGSSYSTKLAIDAAGNVGIGTTSPAHLLSINTGSGKSIEFNWWTPGSTNYIQSYDRTNAAYLPMTTFASSTIFHNGSSESGRIDADGLKFNGDTAAANALDDYEEGTYTPTYTGDSAAGTTTYTQNTGVYTKIGRTVTVWVDMTITSMSGASGTPQISLPFTAGTAYGTDAAGSTRYDMGAFMSWQTADNFTGTRRPAGWITNNGAVMYMYAYTTAGVGGLTFWTLNTTGRISGKIIYTAAF